MVEAVIARKGLGMWIGRAADGAPKDDDRQRDGAAGIALADVSFLERGGPQPPSHLAVGDVIFAIDFTDFEYWVLQVQPGDLSEGSDGH